MNPQNGFSQNALGLDLLMNRKKASINGSQVSSVPPSMGAPSIRSVRLSRDHIPQDQETVSIAVDDDDELDSVSEINAAPKGFQRGFEEFRSRGTPSQSEKSYTGIQPRMSSSHYMSHDDVLDQKREILYQLDRLEKRGVKLPRKFTLASPLDEMQSEYERLKRDRELDASVKFQKRMLMAAVTGVEFLNNRFDPLDVKLNGWSESMHDSLGDYDEVMEELADKYRGRAKIAPEIKLMMMVSGSAFMFHLQQKYFKSMPGIDQIFQQNPDLMRQFAGAAMNTMAGNQNAAGNPLGAGFANVMGNMFGAPSAPAPTTTTAQRMSGPTGVDDLLKELQNAGINTQPEPPIPTAAQNDRVEVQSLADSDNTDDASLEGLLRAAGTVNL